MTDHKIAIQKVSQFRSEVVTLVGICGHGTHPLSDILEDLGKKRISPEVAVVKAEAIRDGVLDFR